MAGATLCLRNFSTLLCLTCSPSLSLSTPLPPPLFNPRSAETSRPRPAATGRGARQAGGRRGPGRSSLLAVEREARASDSQELSQQSRLVQKPTGASSRGGTLPTLSSPNPGFNQPLPKKKSWRKKQDLCLLLQERQGVNQPKCSTDRGDEALLPFLPAGGARRTVGRIPRQHLSPMPPGRPWPSPGLLPTSEPPEAFPKEPQPAQTPKGAPQNRKAPTPIPGSHSAFGKSSTLRSFSPSLDFSALQPCLSLG